MSKIELWLTHDNNNERFMFPVNPSQLDVSNGTKNQSYMVHRLGEATVIQKGILNVYKFAGFFPKEHGPYCGVSPSKLSQPWSYVKKIQEFKSKDMPSRFIVTGTPINVAVSIEDFNFYEKGGDVGTIYFDIILSEYRFLKAKKITIKKKKATPPKSNSRPNPKVTPKTYNVKSKDCLTEIAVAIYKDYMMYKKIASLNGIKSPYTIYPNQKLKLP